MFHGYIHGVLQRSIYMYTNLEKISSTRLSLWHKLRTWLCDNPPKYVIAICSYYQNFDNYSTFNEI